MNKKTRLLELGKDLLIALLACSALLLAARTQLAGPLSGLLSAPDASSQTAAQPSGQVELARPVRIAATGRSGESIIRYGIQYDREGTDALFQRVASLLVEALSDPSQARAASQREWRTALTSAPSLYFDLLGTVPLPVLSGWLGGESAGQDCPIRQLVLAVSDGAVTLYYRNETDGKYYARQADVVNVSHLETAVTGLTDNGAFFAFESETYGTLAPYTMLLPETPTPQLYSASNPLSDQTQTDALLTALDFQSANNYVYQSPTGTVVRNGNDTLRLSSAGEVSYHMAEGGLSRYPVAAARDGTSQYEAVEACRQLAAATLDALSGSARLVLAQVLAAEGGGWQVDFVYCLDGAMVQLYDEGYAGRFLVRDGQITEFSLHLRSYSPTGHTAVVLPEVQAMAAMSAMDLEGGELLLGYFDNGGDTVSPGWTVR